MLRARPSRQGRVIPRGPRAVVTALGFTQILAWGSSFYLPAALAASIARERGWSLALVVGGLTVGLVVAGLVSPRMGRAVQRHGGRVVLALSSVLLAAGLAVLAAARDPLTFYAAWVVLGVGMGIGLYDAAFATLGRLYGLEARRAITALTLFGGFASTVCWPLTTALDDAFGWRATCLLYAALHLGLALPLHLLVVPASGRAGPQPLGRAAGHDDAVVAGRGAARVLLMLGTVLTLAAVVVAVMSVHILEVLRLRGFDAREAVALGMLIGPAQVGARVVEMVLARRHHPIWTLEASVALMALGLAALALEFPLIGVAIVVYAAGVGIESIARGTLPLALFGAGGYATLMGRLAMPILLAQALAPPLAAVYLDGSDGGPLLAWLAAAALANVALALALYVLCRPALRATSR